LCNFWFDDEGEDLGVRLLLGEMMVPITGD